MMIRVSMTFIRHWNKVWRLLLFIYNFILRSDVPSYSWNFPFRLIIMAFIGFEINLLLLHRPRISRKYMNLLIRRISVYVEFLISWSKATYWLWNKLHNRSTTSSWALGVPGKLVARRTSKSATRDHGWRNRLWRFFGICIKLTCHWWPFAGRDWDELGSRIKRTRCPFPILN